jgi:aspartate racemase
MKTLGLVGGTGWISTVEYYRIINEQVNRSEGGLTFARCIIFSLNYGDIDRLNKNHDLDGVYLLIRDAATKLEDAGVDGLVLCANTLHFFADRLEVDISVPIIHIATATAGYIKKENLSTIGLLGTKTTMEEDFYKKRLENEGITALIPEEKERDFIHSNIMSELLKGIFRQESKDRYFQIIEKLKNRGAEGIVLGCTEIPLLIKPEDIDLPLFNTLSIHSQAAVDFALNRD